MECYDTNNNFNCRCQNGYELSSQCQDDDYNCKRNVVCRHSNEVSILIFNSAWKIVILALRTHTVRIQRMVMNVCAETGLWRQMYNLNKK